MVVKRCPKCGASVEIPVGQRPVCTSCGYGAPNLHIHNAPPPAQPFAPAPTAQTAPVEAGKQPTREYAPMTSGGFSGLMLYIFVGLMIPAVFYIVFRSAYGVGAAVAAAIALILLSGVIGYFGFQTKGWKFFESFGKWIASLTNQESSEKKSNKVPRPTTYWTSQLVVAVGQNCEIPRCRKDTHLQVHHVNPHAQGGTNALSNLLVVCPNHHKDCDRGAISKTQQKAIIARRRQFDSGFKNRWDKSVLKKDEEESIF